MFFKRKSKETEDMSSAAKLAKTLLRSKKVQFCYLKPQELEKSLDEDISFVLTLEPVNYYAEKTDIGSAYFSLMMSIII